MFRKAASRSATALAGALSALALLPAAALASTPAIAILDPGQGVAPPGSNQATLLAKYVAWGVTGLCVMGVFFVCGRMAVEHHRGGGGGEHLGRLGWVLFAAVLTGAASGLVGAVI